ncbi:MAG TPA: N-acetylglucosamine-6-phosphate deacetylase [Lacipirellula sp.]
MPATPPGFGKYVDLQLNGYAGVDFNSDDLTVEAIHEACEQLRADGVAHGLATIITDDLDAMCRRLMKLVQLRSQDSLAETMISGFHVEGPFISAEPGYVGAHPAHAAMPATQDAAARLNEAAGGLLRLMTLAPECDAGGAVTRWLTQQGVRVSAGHCNPTLDELKQAIDAGLSMFTHLGNGCPLQLHRHDNIIQRVLSLSDRLWICFIADGVHVPFVALKNYLNIVGRQRAIVVTDAIAAAGKGPGVYRLAGQEVLVDERLATWAPDKSHLVGSACTMRHAVGNLQRELACSPQFIEQLTVANPRQALGL